MPATFGIIGYPLSHSFSAVYFAKKFAAEHIDATYTPFPLEHIGDFPALLQNHNTLRGLSVTIPYKTAVIPYLDSLDVTAEAVGAVNSIAIKNGFKKGYNTDVTGFEESLRPLLSAQHNAALVLGTGGASLAVAYVLEKLNIPFLKISRTKKDKCITYGELDTAIVSSHTLIINTTPAGMYPKVDECPELPYASIGKEHLLYDLIYNPDETKFLQLGKQNGAAIKNGLEMLYLQAEASWRIWNS